MAQASVEFMRAQQVTPRPTSSSWRRSPSDHLNEPWRRFLDEPFHYSAWKAANLAARASSRKQWANDTEGIGMGLTKRMLEEAEERSYWPTGEGVCRVHLRDAYLRDVLIDVDEPTECTLCEADHKAQVDLDNLLDRVVAVIRTYRRRAIDELYHDSESESGYALPDGWIEDTADVVHDLFGDALDDGLLARVASSIDDDYWFDPGRLWLEGTELYVASWSGFRRLVQSTGTTMQALLDGDLDDPEHRHAAADGLRPSEVLPALLEIVDDVGLVTTIPASTRWFRALHVPPGDALTAARLGSAPRGKASENRMNRAGEPMFYGAADAATGIREIGAAPPGSMTVVGEWRPSRALRLLDLVNLSRPPHLYDIERAWLRWRLLFLADFAANVSQPVGDGAEAEYRATQILIEFLRARVPDLDGIIYRSSITGETCCAIDVDNEACVGAAIFEESLLYMVLGSWRPADEPNR